MIPLRLIIRTRGETGSDEGIPIPTMNITASKHGSERAIFGRMLFDI